MLDLEPCPTSPSAPFPPTNPRWSSASSPSPRAWTNPANPSNTLTDPALIKYWQGWGRPTDIGVVAESAELGYPVGCAWVRLFTGEEPGYGHVSDDIPELAFGVIKELRNRGIGTLLLERLLDDCRTRFPGVSLSVRQDNPAARLYEKLGVRQEGDAFTNRVGTSSLTMLLRFAQGI